MKLNLIQGVILCLALFPVTAYSQATNTITVDIRDFEDGRDWLILQGSTVQWQHYDYELPGTWNGANYPTWITTTYNGITNLNSYPWYPDWSGGGGVGAYSSQFNSLVPILPSWPLSNFQMQIIAARDSMTVIQAPSATNAYKTIVEFNDDPSSGAIFYETLLTYSWQARLGLNIFPLENAVLLEWPTNLSGYVLQTNNSLNPTTWGVLATNCNISSGFYIFTNAISGSQLFYRLVP